MARESRRYLGLELAGAKNQKTALAVLEFYPKEDKVFLLDIHDRIQAEGDKQNLHHASSAVPHASSDEALIHVIHELSGGAPHKSVKMGVNVPLELPPCLKCSRKGCRPGGKCLSPAVKWMREITKKAQKNHDVKVLEFTPYTQRPVELWVRYQVMPKLESHERFEIDETLGGNKAPLTARMIFLKRHLRDIHLIEAWPKLTIAILAEQLGLGKRIISAYRKLEEGVHAREEILEALTEQRDIFIYERDIRKLAGNLSAFDAFVCAYTALLSDLGQTTKAPSGFPVSTGWVQYPVFSHR